MAPWLHRPRVIYAISNNNRPKKQWTSAKTDYYFHSRTGTDNNCPKFEELEKDAVGKFVPFERKKTIEKTYVDAFRNDDYGTVKIAMAIQNQRQAIYYDYAAYFVNSACGAYASYYQEGWKDFYCDWCNTYPEYYATLNRKYRDIDAMCTHEHNHTIISSL